MWHRLVLAMMLFASTQTAIAATVNTNAGKIRGLRDGNVEAFLGVPYAKPPIGTLRWRAPESVKKWQGTRDAGRFSASCYQPWPSPLFGPYTPEYVKTPAPSEDCLYLNVWTPALKAKLPVLVWIHGGAFIGGSGAVAIYNGRNLSAQGIVVVTINYRVGPLGFMAHPALSAESSDHTSGNYGLMDMIAALRWVHNNIIQFGGDPTKVTIAGQSAGAVAVNDLLAAPAAKGLFVHAIAESGSGLGFPAFSQADAERSGAKFAELLGATTLAALRALPAERIQAAVKLPIAADNNQDTDIILFRPVLDHVVLFADPEDPRSPLQSNVPLLTGFNADEGAAPNTVTTVADFEKMVRMRYGSYSERLLALYPHATDAEASASQRVLARDRYMTSLVLWSTQRTQASGQSVYAYLFNHAVPTTTPPSWGAFHSAEVPYVFGVLDVSERPYVAADHQVAAQISGYWLNFIRHGEPNGSGLPSWRPVQPSSSEVMALGDEVVMQPAVSSPERMAVLRAYAESGGKLSLF